VLNEEHRIYPQAISWLCQGQIKLSGQGRVILLYRKQAGYALVSPSLE